MHDSFEDDSPILSERLPDTGVETRWAERASSGPAPSLLPNPEHRLRYSPRRVLGRGGMGEVRLATDGAIGRDVALKVLGSNLSGSQDARARFMREVRVQGRLEHPAIVPVYDTGTDADGNFFFSMKHVSGRTLDEILHGNSKEVEADGWTLSRLLGVFRQVCLAIDYAHSRGVVHRDLKPTNVMVGDFGQVYVLDWGIAKELSPLPGDSPEIRPLSSGEQGIIARRGSSLGGQTLGGELLGTPGYMAPEQIGGAAGADERSDIYALGAILFEILTLQRLHEGETTEHVIRSTVRGADARARTRALSRNVPPELEAVCVRATARNPARRFASVRELTSAIERYVEGDRDLDLRRELAARHADAAEAAAAIALAGGSEANAQRARALAEAGRALALDASAPGAMVTVVRLLQNPPAETPAEVGYETQKEETAIWVSVARDTAFIYAAFLVLCLSLVWLGVRSWVGMAAIVAPLTLALSGCVHVVWVRGSTEAARRLRIPVLIATATAIAGVTGLCGPLILVPTLAVAVAAGGGLWLTERRQRLVNLYANICAIVVPFALEWSGILPRTCFFEGGNFILKPLVVAMPEIPSRVALAVASVGALVGATLFVYRATDIARSARLRLALQSWQLRQLATLQSPDSADERAEKTRRRRFDSIESVLRAIDVKDLRAKSSGQP
jgi:serine/threonine-protein kinase